MDDNITQNILSRSEEKGFDEFTTNKLLELVEDFNNIFGEEYITLENLCNKIFDNLNGSIEFKELGDKTGGVYNGKTGIITINSDSKSDVNKVLFHEIFAHCITRRVKENGDMGIGVKEITTLENGEKRYNGRTLDEGIASIIEEKYIDYKEGIKRENVTNLLIEKGIVNNGYKLPITYAKQIYFILGEDLLKTYFNNAEQVKDKISEADITSIGATIPDVLKKTIETGADRFIKRMDNILLYYEKMENNRGKLSKEEMAGLNEQIDRDNMMIEEFTMGIVNRQLANMEINSKDDLVKLLEKKNNFHNLLINKTEFTNGRDSELYEINSNLISEVATIENISSGQLLDEIENHFKNNDSENNNEYVFLTIQKIREEELIKNILKLDDKNEVIRIIRAEDRFFEKCDNNNMKAICQKIFDYDESMIFGTGLKKETVFEESKLILEGLCSSSIEEFDFNTLEYSVYYTNEQKRSNNVMNQLKSIDIRLVERVFGNINSGNIIIGLYESGKLSDVIHMDENWYTTNMNDFSAEDRPYQDYVDSMEDNKENTTRQYEENHKKFLDKLENMAHGNEILTNFYYDNSFDTCCLMMIPNEEELLVFSGNYENGELLQIKPDIERRSIGWIQKEVDSLDMDEEVFIEWIREIDKTVTTAERQQATDNVIKAKNELEKCNPEEEFNNDKE